MNILIAGGTGFLGAALTEHFRKEDHTVEILTRKATHPYHVLWDGRSLDTWTEAIERCDVLINLCGKSVDCRYTKVNKEAILQSRITTTDLLSSAVAKAKNPPQVFINDSSATIYIHAENNPMTETSGIIGDDFSMNVCKRWEECFFKNELHNTRQVAIRTSIVLATKHGAFPKLKWATLLGMGGHYGNGNQMVSWIHINDFCAAVSFIITSKHIEGAINITAPKPISNQVFMKYLRSSLKVPFGFSPGKLLLEFGCFMTRTETELLLKSRWVIPERLLKNGFRFKYPEITAALSQL